MIENRDQRPNILILIPYASKNKRYCRQRQKILTSLFKHTVFLTSLHRDGFAVMIEVYLDGYCQSVILNDCWYDERQRVTYVLKH